MHEHILVLQPEALQNYGHVWGGASYWDEEAGVADAIEKLRAVRAAGIRTLVDPTAPGLGRNIPRIQRVNAEVDLNILVATGVYAFLELPNFLHYRSPEAIAELFVREIREGIDDTGVKAAFVKCAVEEHGLVGDIPADPRRGRHRGGRDGRAGHGAHERERRDRHGRARGADDPGRRPDADRRRPRGRQQRPRLPPGDRGHRRGARLRPLQHPPLQPRRGPDPDARSRSSRRGTATGSTSRTTPPASTTSWSATPTSPTSGRTTSTSRRRSFPCSSRQGVTQAQIDELMVDNPRRFFDATSTLS